MTDYSVAGFLVITGICLLAAVRHFSAGLWRPYDKSNILFSAMCCCAAGMGWTLAQMYRTWTIDAYTSLLKWNVSFVLVFFALLPWFASFVTGRRAPRILSAFSIGFLVLLTLHLIRPHGVQLDEITRIDTTVLPWGETISRPRSGLEWP